MSQTVSLASGTWVKLGEVLVQLQGAVNVLFPTANSLDAVAEILRASARQVIDPSGVSAANLPLNAAIVNRQIVATAALEGGYAAGTALDITYGPAGNKLYTSRGVAPVLVPASTTIEDAADTIVVADFDQNLSSVLNNYLLGFSAKVAGVARVINSAARQADNSIIKLTLASAVTPGQAVVISFDPSLSDIVNATGGKPAAFTDAVVINNVV